MHQVDYDFFNIIAFLAYYILKRSGQVKAGDLGKE